MIAATLFSGIGAPECAMPHWDWPWHAEVEKFPSAVMAARHPRSLNLGDVTADDFCKRALAITPRTNVIVFGSPCQDFSVAGKRLGMDGARGNLTLIALGILSRLKPDWFLFENVPGLLSAWSGAADGPAEEGAEWDTVENSDFAAFLGAVSELGYSLSWTILDAQYRGLAQRRDRLFAVGHLGDDWRPSAAVLFEPESLCGNSPPSREAWQGIAGATGGSAEDGRIAGAVSSKWAKGTGGPAGDEAYNLVASTLCANDAGLSQKDGIEGRVIPILEAGARTGVSTADPRAGMGVGEPGDPMFTLQSGKQHAVAIAFDTTQITSPTNRSQPKPGEPCHPLAVDAHPPAVAFNIYPSSGQGSALEAAPTDIASAIGAMQNSGNTERGTRIVEPVAFQTRIARNGRGQPSEIVPALNGADAGATSDMRPCIALGAAVRRLTPLECERLQGFADHYTRIDYKGKPAADSPRYKALGNSMAVPVIRLILERIEYVDGILKRQAQVQAAADRAANGSNRRTLVNPKSMPTPKIVRAAAKRAAGRSA